MLFKFVSWIFRSYTCKYCGWPLIKTGDHEFRCSNPKCGAIYGG